MKTKILYLDCCSGLSGDMFVGAMLDLGWPDDRLQETLNHAGIAGECHAHISHVVRCNIRATKFDLHPAHGPADDHHHLHSHEHGHEHSHQIGHVHGRSFAQIQELLSRSRLAPEVIERACAVFRRIAVAEGKIHGMPPESVTFHEVGAVDSIADIVLACQALKDLQIDRVLASVPVDGTGEVRCAHGIFPLPAPATLEILAGVPVRQLPEVSQELLTPTGAALLAEFVSDFGPMPELVPTKIGYGAGSRDFPNRPNLVRAVLAEKAVKAKSATPEEVIELRVNLDDCTPEVLGSVSSKLLEEGAVDVFLQPAQMKKNRPGFLLTALARVGDELRIARLLLRETTAFGVRFHPCSRLVLEREFREVSMAGELVRIKEGRLDGELLQISPEFDDCEALSRKTGRPVRDIYAEASLKARETAH